MRFPYRFSILMMKSFSLSILNSQMYGVKRINQRCMKNMQTEQGEYVLNRKNLKLLQLHVEMSHAIVHSCFKELREIE